MIELRACRKVYPGRNGQPPVVAVDGVDLVVGDEELVAILGPSGCGKTTLLKLVAGLLPCTSGELRVNGSPVTGPRRDCAVVFQHHALLPWADVLRNVAFGLELRRLPRGDRERVALDLIRLVGLTGFEHHLPRQLSGGMQQRVGLARALAVDPQTLLMDEPFGSVDAQTRRLLQEDLLRLQSARPRSVVFITHSMDEAVRLGDRVVLLGPRPARVSEILDVGLPRPRPADVEKWPRFVELKEHLWERLRTMQA